MVDVNNLVVQLDNILDDNNTVLNNMLGSSEALECKYDDIKAIFTHILTTHKIRAISLDWTYNYNSYLKQNKPYSTVYIDCVSIKTGMSKNIKVLFDNTTLDSDERCTKAIAVRYSYSAGYLNILREVLKDISGKSYFLYNDWRSFLIYPDFMKIIIPPRSKKSFYIFDYKAMPGHENIFPQNMFVITSRSSGYVGTNKRCLNDLKVLNSDSCFEKFFSDFDNAIDNMTKNLIENIIATKLECTGKQLKFFGFINEKGVKADIRTMSGEDQLNMLAKFNNNEHVFTNGVVFVDIRHLITAFRLNVRENHEYCLIPKRSSDNNYWESLRLSEAEFEEVYIRAKEYFDSDELDTWRLYGELKQF